MDDQVTLNLANVPRELTLILELLKKDNRQFIEVNGAELVAGIDWELFIEQAVHHRVYPVLYTKCKEISEPIIPPNVIQYLSLAYKRNTFKMLQLSAEMELVSKLFTENHIRLVFLKGPVIAHDLYGDISLRTSSDLDFLIPISKLEKAEDILRNLGYEKDDYFTSVLNDWKWRHHHVTYFHPQKQMKLEIHWKLNPGLGFEPSFEELWLRKRKSNLTTSPVYLLGKEDLFCFLASHGARHGWSRLRWLLDIHQMIGQDIDWEKTSMLLKGYHSHRVGAQALVLSTKLLHSKLIDTMERVLDSKHSFRLAQGAIFYFERMVNLHTDPVPKEISKYHARHLRSLMSSKQKALFVLSCLHPLPEDTEVLPLPKQLHFLYFPLRPFIWALRRKRKHSYPRGNES
ncbi:nucleotidyltransferase domain-containing protein [Metabacillus halosaccharovorans]|uniref:nucleotidyltransferase domain-containing protein n=1 Tax=Metabacillus halosaccharovorans TaxID=930124 RepID=UPI003736C545